jgi:hypothetical protein
MKKFILLFFISLSLNSWVFAETPSLIFINSSNVPFEFTEKTLKQARLFNPNIPIYYIDFLKTTSKRLSRLKEIDVRFIPYEGVKLTNEHKEYLKIRKENFKIASGLSKDVLEKWITLYDFIKKTKLTNTFFVELDTLLYIDLLDNVGLFQNFFSSLATPFENDDSATGNFVYIRNAEGLQPFVQFIIKEIPSFNHPNKLFCMYRKKLGKQACEILPILPEEYTTEASLVSLDGHRPKEKKDFCAYYQFFNSIFDASAVGEYLAGVDLEIGFKQTGHLNSRSILNPYHFKFEFENDELGRKIPLMIYKGKKIRVNNLKVESFQLDTFLSI